MPMNRNVQYNQVGEDWTVIFLQSVLLLYVKNIKTQNRLLRFARNDNIICSLGGGEGLVGGFAANQPLPSRIALKPLSLRDVTQKNI